MKKGNDKEWRISDFLFFLLPLCLCFPSRGPFVFPFASDSSSSGGKNLAMALRRDINIPSPIFSHLFIVLLPLPPGTGMRIKIGVGARQNASKESGPSHTAMKVFDMRSAVVKEVGVETICGKEGRDVPVLHLWRHMENRGSLYGIYQK